MTGAAGSPQDRDALAAELALGLLDGADLREAQSLARADASFAGEVGRWTGRFAPLLDLVEPAEPPASVWPAIERRLAATAARPPANDDDAPGAARPANVVALRRSRNAWRGASVSLGAVAAALALYVATAPPTGPIPTSPTPTAPAPTAAAPMVAALASETDGVLMVATWDPGQRRLLMTSTGDATPAAGRAHELWVIPADGTPRSLGTLPAEGRARMDVGDALARQLAAGATLAVSVEPEGGSPTGQPTGPVIAAGPLEQA